MMDGITLIHGDCIAEMAKMPECSVDLALTDPPYKTITGGDSGDRPKGMLSGNRRLFEHQFDIEIADWIAPLYRVLKEDSHAYIFTNALNMTEMLVEAQKVGFKLHNILVWEKNNCTPSQFYMKNAEYVLFLRKGKAKWIRNIGSSFTVHRVPNIIGGKLHPCEKPIPLLRMYIENSTENGDVVLDPFMGSCSAGAACAECGRRFIGIEKDADFFATAERRMESLSRNGLQGELF